jgi:hypothetical protein
MAKRAAPDEKPYRPLLDAELVNAAISHVGPGASRTASAQPAASAKILEMPRTEQPRRVEHPPAVFETSALADAYEQIDADRPRVAPQVVVEKFDQEKRILFTRPESQAIDRLVVSLATRLNAQVKVSHVIRALVGLMLHAEAAIDKRAGETGPLVRPANGDAQGLQKFERDIGKIFAAALRDAGPLR